MSLSAEQQEIRRTRIGGSEIAAVAGLNPWQSPIDIWMRKTGRDTGTATSYHLERGTHLGPGVATWFAARTGRRIQFYGENELTCISRQHDICCATPDAFVDDDAVLECKMPGHRTAHHWGADGTDEVPDYYVPQGMWEMAATGRDVAWYAAVIDGDLRTYRLAYDAELVAMLVEHAERFWRDYVVPDVAPPVDGGEASARWLATRYPIQRAKMMESTPQIDDLASKLMVAQRFAKEAEDAVDRYKNQIKAIIGDAEGVAGEWGKIYWRTGKLIERVDWRAVAEAMHPDASLIAAHTTVAPSARAFRPYWAKEGS